MQGYHEVACYYPQDMFIKVVFNHWKNQQDGFESHWHERIEILVITEGMIHVICDGQIFEAKAGDIVFFNPNQLHSAVNGESGVKYYCITAELQFLISVEMNACDAWMLQLSNKTTRIANHLRDPEIFELFLQLIDIEEAQEAYYEILLRGYLTICIGKMMGKYCIEHGTAVPQEPLTHSFIAEVIDYISKHYQEELSSQKLADYFGFSLSYLCRCFKKETGETLTDYIKAVRLSQACILLGYSTYSVAEIAEKVGYTSVNYFNSQFKETIGVTPLWYRNRWDNYGEKIMPRVELTLF